MLTDFRGNAVLINILSKAFAHLIVGLVYCQIVAKNKEENRVIGQNSASYHLRESKSQRVETFGKFRGG